MFRDIGLNRNKSVAVCPPLGSHSVRHSTITDLDDGLLVFVCLSLSIFCDSRIVQSFQHGFLQQFLSHCRVHRISAVARDVRRDRLCKGIATVVPQSGGVHGKAHDRADARKRVCPTGYDTLCGLAELHNAKVVAKDGIAANALEHLGRGVGIQLLLEGLLCVIRPLPHVRTREVVEIVDTLVEALDNIFGNIVESVIRHDGSESVLHRVRKRGDTALCRVVVLGDTVVEARNDVRAIALEGFFVDPAIALIGKPRLHVGSPRGHTALAVA